MKFCTRLIGHRLGISTCVFLLAPFWRAGAQALPGTIDSSFNASVNGQVHAVAIQPDGRIYIGGTFDWVGGFQPGLARLRTNGTRDASFSASVDGSVSSILLDAAGNIVIGGAFRSVTSPSSINSLPRANLARLFSDGRLDEMFYAMANTNVRMSMHTDPGRTYYFESTPVNPVGWAVLQTIPGSGGEETFTDPNPAGPRLYRIRVE